MLEKLRQRYHLLPSRNPSLLEWKKQGKKVLGYFCINIPEEMVYAAGALPVRLLGDSSDVARVYSHFPAPTCYFSRNLIELALRGEYQALDGMITTYACDTTHGLADVLEETVDFPYYFFVNRPHDAKREGALDFYIQELSVWKESLEGFLGRKITEQALAEAIKVYNLNRSLLRQIYNLRGRAPPLLSGTEVAELTLANMVLPKEESNQMLSRILQEAANRPGPFPDKRPRLHVSGSVLSDLTLFEMVEECGGVVVSDDLCVGSRYFWEPVETTLSPLEALAQRYLGKVPCPCMNTLGVLEEREDFIKGMVLRYKANGVLFCTQRFCDPHQFDHPFLVDRFKKAGIPVLSTEVEQGLSAGLRSELKAFVEILKGA